MVKKNLTLRLDSRLIRAAKIRALMEGTTLTKVVEKFLIEYSKHVKLSTKDD
jgi:hypothetical protein